MRLYECVVIIAKPGAQEMLVMTNFPKTEEFKFIPNYPRKLKSLARNIFGPNEVFVDVTEHLGEMCIPVRIVPHPTFITQIHRNSKLKTTNNDYSFPWAL